MKGFRFGLILCFFILMISNVYPVLGVNLSVTSIGTNAANWTVMLYLDGDNDLENTVKKVINNLELVGSDKNINIIAQFDAYTCFEGVKRYYITYDTSEDIVSDVVEFLDEKNMGDPVTLYDFVAWSCEKYPADNYYLSLFDHGNGWRPRFLKDETSHDELTLNELKNAMKNIKNSINKKIDVVSFDACLMGMIEVLYQIRDTADIVVGSEDVVYGNGLPYHIILEELKKNPYMSSEKLAREIIDAYYYYYSHYSMAMGAFKLEDLTKKVVKKLDAFAITLSDSFSEFKTEIKEAVDCTTSYNVNIGGKTYITHYKDLYDFAYEISTHVKNNLIKKNALELMDEIKNCTIYKKEFKKDNSHGISIYLPVSKKDYDASYENLDLCKNTNWDVFVSKCLDRKKTSKSIELKSILPRELIEKIIFFIER
ncbi:MAG: hypothetical protein DRM98_04810 [Thermoplasmata archaeon]|nr:MAG: hypothetical protein DRM98_04810 [Thermoplasmata archaeon]